MKQISISSRHVKAALEPKSPQKKSKEKVQRERELGGKKKEEEGRGAEKN